MAELYDPEIEWDASEALVLDTIGIYRGIEAVRQWWREWFDAWETLQFEYELVDAGDRAVWLLDLRMLRGRSTPQRRGAGGRMKNDNAEIVRKTLDAYSRRDIEALRALN